MPMTYAIQIGDEFATKHYPKNMATEIANARKFSTVADALHFVAVRKIPGLIFYGDFKIATLGFVIVPISDLRSSEIEHGKSLEWHGMTTEERINELTFNKKD